MKRIAIVALIVGVLLVAGCGVSQEEYDKVVADLNTCQQAKEAAETDLATCQTDLVTCQTEKQTLAEENETLKKQIAEQAEEIETLLAENEGLRQPALEKIPAEVVGTVSLDELVQLVKDFFPNATGGSIGAFTSSAQPKGSAYPLVSLDTLKDFLAKDITEWCPSCRGTSYNPCIERAFLLKYMWLEYAHLPTLSLGIIQTLEGEALRWLNIFITRENGQLTIYKVDPNTDHISSKLEEPDLDVVYFIIRDRL